jgi:tyrosine-protein phosphatase YwqE
MKAKPDTPYANSNLPVSTLYNSNCIENKYVSRNVKRGWGKSVQRASVMLIEQRVIHLTISLTEQFSKMKAKPDTPLFYFSAFCLDIG